MLEAQQAALQRQQQQRQQQQQNDEAASSAPGPPPLEWPAWLNDATACFAEQPKTYIGDVAIASKVVRVRQALVGVGTECRAHLFCNGDAA